MGRGRCYRGRKEIGMSFRTRLFGYDRQAVDARLNAQDVELNSLRSQLSSLGGTVEGLKEELLRLRADAEENRDLKKQQYDLRFRLEEMTARCGEAEARASQHSVQLENYGRLYYSAVENASNITQNAYQRAHELLQNAQTTAARAREAAAAELVQMQQEQEALRAALREISQAALRLEERLTESERAARQVIKAPVAQEDVKLRQEYEAIMAEFEKTAAQYAPRPQTASVFSALGQAQGGFAQPAQFNYAQQAQTAPSYAAPAPGYQVQQTVFAQQAPPAYAPQGSAGPANGYQQAAPAAPGPNTLYNQPSPAPRQAPQPQPGYQPAPNVLAENFVPILEEQKRELSAQTLRDTVNRALAGQGEQQKRPNVRELLKKYSQL